MRDTPTGSMVAGSRIARILGYEVSFIESHKDFDGVAYEGIAAVSPSEKYPEVGLIVRVTQKLFGPQHGLSAAIYIFALRWLYGAADKR